jgi:hypothetical protein
MRALFAVVVWLASLAAASVGVCMADESDETHLADMVAPPWIASAKEQTTADRTGFDPCEQVVKALTSRGGAKLAEEAYTTSHRWGKILRAKITDDSGGAATLATCWIDASGRASIVVKIDDGEP